jgi:hypothetical protein
MALPLLGALLSLPAPSVPADGLRDIASVTLTTYFDGTWQLETTDVFIGRVSPAFSFQARVTRMDAPGWYQHTVSLGPIVNFTDTWYASATYAFGIDVDSAITHEATAEVDYETATTATSLGVKADWFPATGYWYVLPSVSGKFHPVPALGLFGKFFLSVDNVGVLTESFWGEADYAFSKVFGARAGFTVSRANLFGYSFGAGVDVTVSPAVSLRYMLQYLSDTVQYIGAPQPRSGLVNSLVADFRF